MLGFQGLWQHQVLRGGWQLGQQEILCSRRVWQPVLAKRSSTLAWRTPSLAEKPGRPVCTGREPDTAEVTLRA